MTYWLRIIFSGRSAKAWMALAFAIVANIAIQYGVDLQACSDAIFGAGGSPLFDMLAFAVPTGVAAWFGAWLPKNKNQGGLY